MKKIMKKALSLALALVMVLTLAPVTAQAADTGTADLATGLYDNPATLTVAANSTVYYETSMPDGASYEFVVSGATGFSVDSCAETDGTWTASGNSVADTSGVVTTTIQADSASWGYYAGFTVTNNTSVEQQYTAKIVYPEGSQANPKAVTINLNATATITVPANSQYYVNATLPETEKDYQLTITGSTGFGIPLNYMQTVWDTDGELVTTANAGSYYGYYSMSIVNNTSEEQTYSLVLANMPLGAKSNPDTLTVGTTVTKELDGSDYWYTWTATEAGTFTFTIDNDACTNGWTYDVNGACYSTGWDEYDKNEYKLTVAADDVVKLGVWVPTYMSDYDSYEPYTPGAGTVKFATAFAAGVVNDENNNNNNNNNDTSTEGEITGGDENYAESTAPIVVGDNALTVSNMYAYTVFTFEPTEIGTYTLTSEDSVMGIVSTNGMWVTTTPSEETVASNTLTWECSSVGQSIMIAVLADTNVANVKVVREDLVINEIPQTVYAASAEAYVFTGDASAIEYVDVQGATTDVAVLGDDGFYHLNDKTGPVLLVNLDDSVFTFVTAETFGKLAVSNYENGELVSTTAYGEYVEACLANADSVTHPDFGDLLLYPLTEGLMEVYKTYGAQQGWYNTDMGGYVIAQFNNKYNADDIWMFACMYVPNEEDGNVLIPPVVAPEADENNVINEESLEVKIDKAVAENRDLVVETTADGVLMTFAAEDLKDAKAVALNIEVALKNDVKDETVAKNDKITDKNFVMKVEFSHEGNLPTTATITIPVSADFAGKTLYYYEILTDGTLKFVCEAPVDANGVASVAQDHCSDYVLLTERVDVVEPETTPGNPTTGAADPETSTTPNGTPTTTSPKTGDDTNIALWVAVLGLGVVAIAGSVVMRKREF